MIEFSKNLMERSISVIDPPIENCTPFFKTLLLQDFHSVNALFCILSFVLTLFYDVSLETHFQSFCFWTFLVTLDCLAKVILAFCPLKKVKGFLPREY